MDNVTAAAAMTLGTPGWGELVFLRPLPLPLEDFLPLLDLRLDLVDWRLELEVDLDLLFEEVDVVLPVRGVGWDCGDRDARALLDRSSVSGTPVRRLVMTGLRPSSLAANGFLPVALAVAPNPLPLPPLLVAWAMASITALVSSFSAALVEICILRLDLRLGDGPGGAPAVARTAGTEMDSLAVPEVGAAGALLLKVPTSKTDDALAPDAPGAPEAPPEAASLAEAEALTLVGLSNSGRAASGLATPRAPLSNGRLAVSASPPTVLALRVATTLLTKAVLLRAFWLFTDMGLDTSRPVETEAAEAEAAGAVPAVAVVGGTGRAAGLCPLCCGPPPPVLLLTAAVDGCF